MNTRVFRRSTAVEKQFLCMRRRPGASSGCLLFLYAPRRGAGRRSA
jgi:hypothetical protein